MVAEDLIDHTRAQNKIEKIITFDETGEKLDYRLPLQSQTSNENNQISQSEFVDVIRESFFELIDLAQMIKWIENTTKYLKNFNGLFCYYDRLVQINFVILKNSILNPFLHSIDKCLLEFFLQFRRNCLEWKISEQNSI
ncbi:hypothetical protein QR98_0021630 [Sarcoptes scabiei]|uniref:Uncharacterized protein n=1 Tax=Sarcoptes scabiei TaxID=52283 RepID=A0A131ZYY6_SARSC|nr:hypothetical protein QR98_0021630 [Sarcoptes scabiei]